MTRTNERDGWLSLDDDALVAQCKVDNYRAGGPGGQHRNKVSSAVRLRHEPSGVVAHAEESRSQHENKKRAIRRLRLEIALNVRAEVATRPSLDSLAGRAMQADAARRNEGGGATPLPGEGGAGGGSSDSADGNATRSDWSADDCADTDPDLFYEPPAVFLQYRTKAGRIEVSTKNHDFALVVAAVLDVLAGREGSLKEAAALLGVSTSQLSRFITNEPPILRAANRIREQHGLKHLTTGN